MSSVKRNRVVFQLELTNHIDSAGKQIELRTNMNSAIWIQIDDGDHPDPMKLNHRLEGKYWQSEQILMNPYKSDDQLIISYRYHFGSTQAGNWKYTSPDFKLCLIDLRQNNIECKDIWDDPTQSVINLKPLNQKLANINIKFRKDIGEANKGPRLKALYLMGPIETGLATKEKNEELQLDYSLKVWNIHRMEAVGEDRSLWQTKVQVPLEKIREYDYRLTNH